MDTQRKDKETEELELELKAIKDFIETEAFKILGNKLFEKINALQNIAEIPDALMETPERFVLETKARKLAASIIFEWWKADVVGAANQFDHINSNPVIKPFMIQLKD